MPRLKKVPENCDFPQLSQILDKASFKTHLQKLAPEFADGRVQIERLKVKRVYYKHGGHCRLMFTMQLRPASGPKLEQLYFAKLLSDDECRQTYGEALRGTVVLPSHGPAVAWLRDLGMVVWAYPNDPYVPGLATLSSRERVEELMQQDPTSFGLAPDVQILDVRHEVAKYVPGQRCCYRYVVRWQNGDGIEREHRLIGKAYRDGSGASAYEIMLRVQESPAFRAGALRAPVAYGHDREHDIIWQEQLPDNRFAKGPVKIDLGAFAAKVGRSLAAFHASHLQFGPGIRLADEIENLQKTSRKICETLPEHREQCGAIVRRLLTSAARLPVIPETPVHGSFKMSHIFDMGDGVAFIDFDGAGLGDPAYDVGRFLAHLAGVGLKHGLDDTTVDDAIQKFKQEYSEGVSWGWVGARIHWYTSSHLISSQAHRCIKRMVPDQVGAILSCADRWSQLDEGP